MCNQRFCEERTRVVLSSRAAAPSIRSSQSDQESYAITMEQQSKPNFRMSPFRRVAKSARINLNRYWGLLSNFHSRNKYEREIEENRINELIESHALASSQNSINSQREEIGTFLNSNYYDSYLLPSHSATLSPPPTVRLIRKAKRSLPSSPPNSPSAQELEQKFYYERYESCSSSTTSQASLIL